MYFLFLFIHIVYGNFNFYIDKEEFKRITGATFSQIYIVQHGIVNSYALSHIMNVPHNIHYLDFRWEATGKRVVHYSMETSFSDFFALLQPHANISNVGRVPSSPQTIRIHVPCSGRIATQVPVSFTFTFSVRGVKQQGPQHHTTPHHNLTTVELRRNKICLKTREPHNPQDHDPVQAQIETEHPPQPPTNPNYLVNSFSLALLLLALFMGTAWGGLSLWRWWRMAGEGGGGGGGVLEPHRVVVVEPKQVSPYACTSVMNHYVNVAVNERFL